MGTPAVGNGSGGRPLRRQPAGRAPERAAPLRARLSFTRPRPPDRVVSRALAAVCAIAAALSVRAYQRDRDERAAAETFATTFALDERRTEKVEAARYQGAGDLMATAVAVAALPDALDTVNL